MADTAGIDTGQGRLALLVVGCADPTDRRPSPKGPPSVASSRTTPSDVDAPDEQRRARRSRFPFWAQILVGLVLGALLGWLSIGHLVVGLAAGFLVGGVAAMALLVGGRVGLKSSIAYGPAMCLGVWVAVLWTSRILTALLDG